MPNHAHESGRSFGEEERTRFIPDVIADALTFRQEGTDDGVAVVEQALADTDAGIGLIPFEDVCRQWDAERAARTTTDRP